ncbi:MAG: sulfite oxidase [Isosphaera sp.]|nr:sulfite oxidase [Isosphaera sp.]
MPLSRRDLFRAVPAAVAAGAVPQFATAADGLVVRMREPRNLETQLADLGPATTPTEAFYVRNHFPVPALDPKTFTLAVEGHVGKPLTLSLDDLQKMGTATLDITLECAGNGRVFLVPPARGLQWGHGAVGTAKWTGVALGAVLERAGVKAGAVDVVLVGADKGAIADPATPGPIPFDRGIPLAKAKADETLLAWHMNGAPLTADHGAPLRAVVGGWYGMASVKWLTRVVVTDRPYTGFWQTFDYSVWERAAAGPRLVPVTAIQPKAVVTSVGPGAVVKAAGFVLSGRAWAGEHAVAKVEFTLDGGKTWQPAKHDKGRPLGWVAWESGPLTAPAGVLRVAARCTDDKGTTQPEARDPDRRTYMINHLVPTEVTAK